MKVYTYSEARQQLAKLLNEALKDGEVRIRGRDGTTFALTAVDTAGSPLDVPGLELGTSREEILAAISVSRER